MATTTLAPPVIPLVRAVTRTRPVDRAVRRPLDGSIVTTRTSELAHDTVDLGSYRFDSSTANARSETVSPGRRLSNAGTTAMRTTAPGRVESGVQVAVTPAQRMTASDRRSGFMVLSLARRYTIDAARSRVPNGNVAGTRRFDLPERLLVAHHS